jgi:hypothetical protein
VRNELDHPARVGLERLAGRGDDLEVDGIRRLGRERTDLPCGGLSDTDLRLSDPCRLLVGRDGVANESRHLELLRRLQSTQRPSALDSRCSRRQGLAWTSKVALNPISR